MTRKILLAAVVLGGLAATSSVQAQGIQVTATVNGVSQTFSFSSQEEALNSLTGPGLAARFPGFVEGSAVTANINNNGQPLNLTVPAGSTTAILVNPITGAAIAIPAATAGGAVNNTRAFFQGDTSVTVPVSSLPASVLASLPAAQRAALLSAPVLTPTSILQSAVQNTISDPIAGNPTALIPQMVASDFIAGSAPTGGLLGVNQPRADGWRFNIGANIIATTGGGADTRVFTAPLRASYYLGRTGTEIFLDAPMAFVDVGGTNVFQGSAGVGIRQRVLTGARFEWNITPAFRWGVAGSQDIGRGSQAVGASGTSDFRFALSPIYTLAITNTIAYYQTERYNFGGGAVNYDLQNQFYRNGLTLSRPVGEIFGRPAQMGLTFVDTRVTGDPYRVKSWQEYGVVLASGGRFPSRFSVTYMNGENNFQALRFGLGTSF